MAEVAYIQAEILWGRREINKLDNLPELEVYRWKLINYCQYQNSLLHGSTQKLLSQGFVEVAKKRPIKNYKKSQ